MDKNRIPVEALPIGAVMLVPGNNIEDIARQISDFHDAEITLSYGFSVQEFTHYYDREMAPEITKYFYYLHELRPIEGAEAWKKWSNKLEENFADQLNHNRPINIDPGYLTLSKLVLFSTKGFSHRIYIRDRIYAEVTLQYRQNEFHALPWTYNDYQTEEAFAFWREARAKLAKLLQKARASH